MKLIINRIKYHLLIDDNPSVYFSNEQSSPFSIKRKHIELDYADSEQILELKKWFETNKIKNDDFISFGFFSQCAENEIVLPFIDKYKKFLIKSILYDVFKANGLLVEAKPLIDDLSVYRFIESYDNDWDRYEKYDFSIRTKRKELAFNVVSNFTLISRSNIEYKDEFKHAKYIDLSLVKAFPKLKHDENKFSLVANKEIKDYYQISLPNESINYSYRYKQLFNFYNQYLKSIENDRFSVTSNGLINVDLKDYFNVNLSRNKILFKNDKTDINPVTGMRKFGVYKESPKALSNQFLFIYENKDDANRLYQYFKNGHKNFPGLERYVGIPITLSDFRLHYTNKASLINEYNEFEEKYLIEETYENLFAIVIGDFDKDIQSSEYFRLKYLLLNKGIPSQFINQVNIRKSNTFNFHLPNIAIGILAKLQGVPWRLDNRIYKELVIGFNQVRLDNQQFIGNSVFFTNEGYLSGVNSYPATNQLRELIVNLKNSIEEFIKINGDIERLVIHYYKPHNKKETEEIEKLLYKELRINIPYAIVEINDTKAQMDICFDSEYNYGMPESGTYVKVGYNEYLLFNNTRYGSKPLNKIKDELPIKVKIHFADTGGFSHSDLINQIYEFSRLIWTGLKQKSQPATSIYAKKVAEFSAHFGGKLPENKVSKDTPWFL